ncbi:MAG: TIGR00341 family protein [Cyclobacteriaceae bacterium]|nr:TIGR00341 family protein [Cyclobacteriaceae bacterium]MCH8516315.1 TIGR00341 family protein [Cyclobacteriaceae bacterium]
MLKVYYQADDKETFESDILPHLEEVDKELLELSALDIEDKSNIHVFYLSDQDLIKILDKIANQDLKIGVLPHPELEAGNSFLGVGNKIQKILDELSDDEVYHKADLLYCNDQPVFQAVDIGDMFALKTEKAKGFLRQVLSFILKIWKLRSLQHHPFVIIKDEDSKIETSAIGMIAVEHSYSSVVARRLVSDTPVNDGLLHLFILSPDNILELLSFLLRSLSPLKSKVKKIPSFIGYIRTNKVKIFSKQPFDFTLDGVEQSTKEIELRVEKECIKLMHKKRISANESKDVEKSTYKVDRLPKGEKRSELIQRKLPFLPRATGEEFKELFTTLRENAQVTTPYMVMMALSTLLSTFGLYANSTPVIIGAMILAPLMSPIVSFSMSAVRQDTDLLKKSIITIVAGTILSLIIAAGVSLFIPIRVINPEIDARLSPTLLDLGIAVASGMAAAYAHAREEIAKTLAGVAIAVALVPPLAVAGIALGWGEIEMFLGAFLLYMTNLSGIILFGGLTFLVLGFSPFKRARKGIIYSLITVAILAIPLSYSFKQVNEEAAAKLAIENIDIEDYELRDVRVNMGDKMRVQLTLVAKETIGSEEVEQIKLKIEETIDREIELQATVAIKFDK